MGNYKSIYDVSFILLHFSSLFILIVFAYIYRMKNKKQIHYAFLSTMGLMFVWSFSLVLRQYAYIFYGYTGKLFMYISYIGVCFVPLALFFTGIIFARTKITFSLRYKILCAIPTISYLIILTDNLHGLFYVKYSFFDTQTQYGVYFIIHTVFSYACIIVGLYFLIYSSIKSSGFFSNQSLLLIVGSLVPFIANILYTMKVSFFSAYTTPVAFSFAIICYSFAILKYNFLNVAPIAMQTVVDLISDAFVVVNEEMNIVDYNKTFINNLGSLFNIKRNDNIMDILSLSTVSGVNAEKLREYIIKAEESRKSVTVETHVTSENFDRYFAVEITAIMSNDKYLGTIILLKDITQSKKDLETIKENQAILMEQERLASLGQLIGGIAHNLKTPIMSISGGIEALRDLAKEYDESIGDKSVTDSDHHEIAGEMFSWLDKIKPYCSYMSDIITTVKGQAVQMNDSSSQSFTVRELVNKIDVLMKHELKKYHCLLNTDFQVDMNTEVKGEVNNLVQIFDNIIINAMHSYEGRNGEIEFKVIRSGDNIEFAIKDYGKGIPEDVKSKLFKEMITTKGKHGTGLGLYMSYSTIKGRFGGNMWFVSSEGRGTTFYITIPCYRGRINQEVS